MTTAQGSVASRHVPLPNGFFTKLAVPVSLSAVALVRW
jgi:hypothetical protein